MVFFNLGLGVAESKRLIHFVPVHFLLIHVYHIKTYSKVILELKRTLNEESNATNT